MGLGALAHGSHGTQRDGPELVVPLGVHGDTRGVVT